MSGEIIVFPTSFETKVRVSDGNIVISQVDDPNGDDDAEIYVPLEYVPALIAAIQRLIDDAVVKP